MRYNLSENEFKDFLNKLIREAIDDAYERKKSSISEPLFNNIDDDVYGDDIPDELKDKIVTGYGFPAVNKPRNDGKGTYKAKKNAFNVSPTKWAKANSDEEGNLKKKYHRSLTPFSFNNADGKDKLLPFWFEDEKGRFVDARYKQYAKGVHRVERNEDNFKQFVIPMSCGSIFEIGNEKVTDDSLIFNLTSAQQCPSKECLVKDICYAKNMEALRDNTLIRNLRNQNTVRLLQHKGKLHLLFDLMRVIIYEAEKKNKPINYIRLDEAGDFENAELLKAFDEFAGQIKHGFSLKDLGFGDDAYVDHPVTVMTYSAATDNVDTARSGVTFKDTFANLKNIVVNRSLPKEKVPAGIKDFFCVPLSVYNKMIDTGVKEVEGESYVSDFSGKEISVTRLSPLVYQPNEALCNAIGVPFGTYCYKCPCAKMEDLKKQPGYRKPCETCRACYHNTPATDMETGETVPEYSVVEKAHGSLANDIDNGEVTKKRKKMRSKEHNDKVAKAIGLKGKKESLQETIERVVKEIMDELR